MSLDNAFNYIISLQGRVVQLERYPDAPISLTMAPSNYFRNFASLEETVIEGREFVVSKKELESKSAEIPKRGDVIIDPELGDSTISEVREMVILGSVAGYRIRTS